MRAIRNAFHRLLCWIGLLALPLLPVAGCLHNSGALREAMVSRVVSPPLTSGDRSMEKIGSGTGDRRSAGVSGRDLACWGILELVALFLCVIILRHRRLPKSKHHPHDSKRSQVKGNQSVTRRLQEVQLVGQPSNTDLEFAPIKQQPRPAPLNLDEAWMRHQAHTVLKSTRLKYRELSKDTWWATAIESHGYQVTLEVAVDGRCLVLKAKTWLFFDRDMLRFDLPIILLEANATLQYGSYQLEEFQTQQMVTLGMVCDTDYLPTPLICSIGKNLMKTYQAMLKQLYASNVINLGPHHPEFRADDDDSGSTPVA